MDAKSVSRNSRNMNRIGKSQISNIWKSSCICLHPKCCCQEQIVDCNVAQYRMLLEEIIFKIIKYKLYTTWQYLDKVGTHMIFIVGGLCSVCVMNIAGKLTGWSEVGKEGRGMGGLQLFPPRKHFQASAVSCYQVVSILCQLRWLDNCQNFILSPLAPEWCLRWQWPVSITNLISS